MMHTIKFPLKLNMAQRRKAAHRFYLIWKIHNALVKHGNKLLGVIHHDRGYKALLKQYRAAKEAKDDDLRKSLGEQMNAMRRAIGLYKSGMESYAAVMGARFKKHLSSQQVQKEADRIYTAIEEVLFGDGKELRFRRVDDFKTISSKSMNGCHYSDPLHPSQFKKDRVLYPTGQIVWMDETIRVDIDWSDPYVSLALDHEISYCEITRKMYSDGWHYYVILYLDGPAPVKHLAGNGTAGLDPGVSTMCICSDDALHMDELAPKCKDYDRKIAVLQQKLDRSRRVNNPDEYNANGTVKKQKHKWKKTIGYKKTETQALYALQQEDSIYEVYA